MSGAWWRRASNGRIPAPSLMLICASLLGVRARGQEEGDRPLARPIFSPTPRWTSNRTSTDVLFSYRLGKRYCNLPEFNGIKEPDAPNAASELSPSG